MGARCACCAVAHVLTLCLPRQIVASANTSMSIPWPTLFSVYLNLLKVAMLDVLTLTRTGCATPLTLYDNLLITLAMFVGGSIFGFIALVVLDARNRNKELELHNTIADAQRALQATGLGVTRAAGRRQRAQRTVRSSHKLRQGDGDSVPKSVQENGRGTQRARRASQRRMSMLEVSAATVLEVPNSLRRMRWGRVFKTLALFWTLCYPGISVKLCRIFQCVQVGDDWWLVADMRLQCFDPQWSFMAFLSSIMLVLYTLGLPLGMAMWLWKNRRRLHRTSVENNLGFLYLMYGTHAYMWGVVELLRKLVLTSLIMVFFDSESALQITCALLVAAFSHVAHALWRPYTDRRAYMLQHGSLGVTTLMYVGRSSWSWAVVACSLTVDLPVCVDAATPLGCSTR